MTLQSSCRFAPNSRDQLNVVLESLYCDHQRDLQSVSVKCLRMTHRAEFEQLASRIKELSGGRPVDYVANRGNWGDGLIRAGTLRFFEHFEIPFRELLPGQSYRATRDTLALYGGGGGWCRFWNHGEPLVRSLAESYRHVLVLPTTYDVQCEIPNVTFVARDRFESLANIPQAIFCHDMAFFLVAISAPAGKGTGYFLRTDKESLRGTRPLPPENIDLSLMGHAHSDIGPFLDKIAEFETVVTGPPPRRHRRLLTQPANTPAGKRLLQE